MSLGVGPAASTSSHACNAVHNAFCAKARMQRVRCKVALALIRTPINPVQRLTCCCCNHKFGVVKRHSIALSDAAQPKPRCRAAVLIPCGPGANNSVQYCAGATQVRLASCCDHPGRLRSMRGTRGHLSAEMGAERIH